MFFYQLTHAHKIEYITGEGWVCDKKEIGIYSTQKKADETVEQYKRLPGFREHTNDFKITPIDIAWVPLKRKDSMCFYELTHEYESIENGVIYDIPSHLGYFRTKREAETRKAQLKQETPFIQYPAGFEIGRCIVDYSYWVDGFDTYMT